MTSNAEAQCSGCEARTCSADRGVQKAFEEKKAEMEEAFYPGRLIQLLYRISPRCTSCMESIDSQVKIKYIQNDTVYTRPWSPPLERRLRRALKSGTVEAFYIMVNNGQKCSCCDSGSYKDLDDYDEDLDINRNGPVFIFENPRQVGLNPGDFGDSTNNHYTPAIQPYPPVEYVPPPEAPRIIHNQCKHCQAQADAYNGSRYEEYGFETQFYWAHREANVAVQVLAGLHGEKRKIYMDDSLNESSFFAKAGEITTRINEWIEKREAALDHISNLRTELRSLKEDIPKNLRAFESCEATPRCQQQGPIIADSRPSERIICNEEDLGGAPYVFEDLSRINSSLYQLERKFESCKNDFRCAKIACDVASPIRQNLLETEKRLRETQLWQAEYHQLARKHYKSLFDLSIQSQKNLDEEVWKRDTQAALLDVSQILTNVRDVVKGIHGLIKKPRSPDEAVNLSRKQKILKNLNQFDEAYELAADSLTMLNYLTRDIQIPFVEGQGVPGLRTLNKLTVSLFFCIKSSASELKNAIQNFKQGKPEAGANVLGVTVKALQCYTIVEQMERQKLIDKIEEDLRIQRENLARVKRHRDCVDSRLTRIHELVKEIERVSPKMGECLDGPCGSAEATPDVQFEPKLDSYGRALKAYEPILMGLSQKLQGSAQKIQLTESPEPQVTLTKHRFLPNELMEINYELPWCDARSAFLGILPSSTTEGPRSLEDFVFKRKIQIGGRWQGPVQLRSPIHEGDYDIRVYKSGVDGEELIRKSFETSSHLGPLVERQDFSRYYMRDLANEYEGHSFAERDLASDHGRIRILSLDAAGKPIRTYKYIDLNGQRVTSGWDDQFDLPPGDYEIIVSFYIPNVVLLAKISAGQVVTTKVDGDGRLKMVHQDAMGQFMKSYKYIYDSSTQERVWSGPDDQIDIQPGVYDIHMTDYTPPIVHRGVRVEAGKISSIMSSGYGRLTMDPRDAFGKERKSFVYITKNDTGEKVFQGQQKVVDLPPGTYDLNFSDYTPNFIIKGVRINRGLNSPVSPGAGYGKVKFNKVDGLDQPFRSYVYVTSASDDKKVHQGWENEMELPAGVYNFTFSDYTPSIVIQAEVYEGRERTVFAGGYGQLKINSQANYFYFYDLNEKKVTQGTGPVFNLPPGTYVVKYRVGQQDLEGRVVIRKGQLSQVRL